MNITEKTLPARTYLAIRKTIPFTEVTNKQMYDEAGKMLGAYIAKHDLKVTGPWTVLYFTWDLEKKQTELAIAFPVDEETTIEDDGECSVEHIPQLKVVSGVLEGSYENIKEGHEALLQYLGEEGYEPCQTSVMALEEYVVGPKEEANPEKWQTVMSYTLSK